MGREISSTEFLESDFTEFEKRLRNESLILRNWFDEGSFEESEGLCGFELEAWLIDQNLDPTPKNEEFLDKVNNPLVVPELAKFNVEINSTPYPIQGNFLNSMKEELIKVWNLCEKKAEEMGIGIMAIGIHPKISDELLRLQNMTPMKRYIALNQQVLKLRDGKPLNVKIEGRDNLKVQHRDVMLEATTTSLQIHLQVSPKLAVRHYNIAQILSAPMVAVTANSPFLFGKELWDETRVPVFEQSVEVASFRDITGDQVGRVHFGTGLLNDSLFEAFLENLDGFPVLLPLVTDDDPNWLNHLRLHNGTIWRWNRPLIGLNRLGKPHLRIEHRVIPSGPSITDTIANIAFYVGLDRYFSKLKEPLESTFTYKDIKENFYNAARKGFQAKIIWENGKLLPMQYLLQEILLPAAKTGLMETGIDKNDISFYIDEVMANRIHSLRNGANWQKTFMANRGGNIDEMTSSYFYNQKQNIPVHLWEV